MVLVFHFVSSSLFFSRPKIQFFNKSSFCLVIRCIHSILNIQLVLVFCNSSSHFSPKLPAIFFPTSSQLAVCSSPCTFKEATTKCASCIGRLLGQKAKTKCVFEVFRHLKNIIFRRNYRWTSTRRQALDRKSFS